MAGRKFTNYVEQQEVGYTLVFCVYQILVLLSTFYGIHIVEWITGIAVSVLDLSWE